MNVAGYKRKPITLKKGSGLKGKANDLMNTQ